MKNNKISDIFAYLSLSFGAVWLGAYVTRLIVTYNLFRESELVLKNYITESNIFGIFEALSPLYYITSVTYLFLIICFTLFLIFSKIRLKQNGWLFIVTVIIYFTLPFEVFFMTIDYKLIILNIAKSIDSDLTLTLIIERLSSFSGFSVILILIYLTIPYFIIFKPFSINQVK